MNIYYMSLKIDTMQESDSDEGKYLFSSLIKVNIDIFSPYIF